MRYVTIAGLLLWALCPPPLHAAAAPKPSCKKIRDAVWAGKTLEQVMAEFDTDAQTVMKCTQKQGKRKSKKKPKSPKGTKSKSTKGTSGSTSSTPKSKSSSKSTHKPSAPRSGPWPAHLP